MENLMDYDFITEPFVKAGIAGIVALLFVLIAYKRLSADGDFIKKMYNRVSKTENTEYSIITEKLIDIQNKVNIGNVTLTKINENTNKFNNELISCLERVLIHIENSPSPNRCIIDDIKKLIKKSK